MWKSKFYVRRVHRRIIASSSTPSTRRLLDSVTEYPTQATEFSEFALRLEAKAGNKIRINGNYRTSGSVSVKPQTGKRRTLTRDDDALSVQLDPEDYAKLMRKCEENGRLKVKMKGHLKQRRANSGEAKKKTRVISQWENVNCAEVFP